MNCYYCHRPISITNACLKCPYPVRHFTRKDKLVLIEIDYYEYIICIYFDNRWDDKQFHILKNHKSLLALPKNPGITINNIKQKLPFLLTFQ